MYTISLISECPLQCTLSTLIKVGPYASIKAPTLREIGPPPKNEETLHEIRGRHLSQRRMQASEGVETDVALSNRPYATLRYPLKQNKQNGAPYAALGTLRLLRYVEYSNFFLKRITINFSIGVYGTNFSISYPYLLKK